MLLEDLRNMLLDWAADNEEDAEKYSGLDITGPPFQCELRVPPRYKNDRSGPILVLLVSKVGNEWCFIIRVKANTANMTYDIQIKEKGDYPQLKVRQWETSSDGRSGDFVFTNGVPALVLDLIEARLPTAILDHERSFFPFGTGGEKPCMGCGVSIFWETIICPKCMNGNNAQA